MSRYYAVLRTPPQELRLRVAPARKGVRLDVGERHVYLTATTARELADALHDATETPKEGTE